MNSVKTSGEVELEKCIGAAFEVHPLFSRAIEHGFFCAGSVKAPLALTRLTGFAFFTKQIESDVWTANLCLCTLSAITPIAYATVSFVSCQGDKEHQLSAVESGSTAIS